MSMKRDSLKWRRMRAESRQADDYVNILIKCW